MINALVGLSINAFKVPGMEPGSQEAYEHYYVVSLLCESEIRVIPQWMAWASCLARKTYCIFLNYRIHSCLKKKKETQTTGSLMNKSEIPSSTSLRLTLRSNHSQQLPAYFFRAFYVCVCKRHTYIYMTCPLCYGYIHRNNLHCIWYILEHII